MGITARSGVADSVRELKAIYGTSFIAGLDCDLSTSGGRDALVAFVRTTWEGALDVLVNNVGTNVRKRIDEATGEEYESMMRTNVDSAYFLCKHLQPLLQNGNNPSVVNISSAAGVGSTGTDEG